MNWRVSALLGLGVVLIAGCEPADTGGGGGVGGHVAYIAEGKLAASLDSGTDLHYLTASGQSPADPALSRTGSTIAFAFSSQPNATVRGIWLTPFAAGSTPTSVVEPSAGDSFSSPSWDQASSTIYFVNTSTSGSKIMKISSSATAGTAPTEVSSAVIGVKWITVVSDSLLIATTGSNNDLVSLNLSTNAATPLGVSTTSKPGASPDGKSFAYSVTGGGGHIVVRNIASNADVALPSSSKGGDGNPSFSADSANVAFDAGGQIFFAKADGTGSVQFLLGGTSVSWGP